MLLEYSKKNTALQLNHHKTNLRVIVAKNDLILITLSLKYDLDMYFVSHTLVPHW